MTILGIYPTSFDNFSGIYEIIIEQKISKVILVLLVETKIINQNTIHLILMQFNYRPMK